MTPASTQARPRTIRKRPSGGVAPNMPDYDRARAEFSWAAARAQLAGLPRGGLNIAHEAVDRHADGPLADTVALRFLSRRRPQAELTYADLKREADRFANVLTTLGVKPGERVFVLAGRIPELYVAALGTLKHGSVFCPLFSAFGPEPIEQRLRLGDARVLVTTTALYRRKVAELRWRLPRLAHVLLVGDPDEIAEIPNIEDFRALMGAADAFYEIVPTAPGDMALLHFTSGTTGTPKGDPRARGGGRAPRHRADGARPAPWRCVLVHRRSRVGDGHLVRDHRAADDWSDGDRG
jgi:acetyl-CoA synthetase